MLCLLVALSDKLHTPNPTCEVSLVSVDGLQKEYGRDRAWVTLNVTADLRSLFTWNTKQVFLSVDVDFVTKKHWVNQMMIWSDIIKAEADAHLQLPVLRPAYPFQLTDHGAALRGKPFNVTLHWNVMPKVGMLEWGSQSFSGFQMPDEYVRPEVRRY